MPARAFDSELAALEALRHADPSTTAAPLRKALQHKNNLIVSKAAKLAAAQGHSGLADALAEAFRRFLLNAPKTDPQCWAKNEIAKALAGFDAQDDALFLAGIAHVQLEPVWGGSADTAGTLRGTCALALVQCRSLSSHQVLRHLTPLFADSELPVRVNTARAVEQIGTDSAALLLKLRAELASDAPEVLGACYAGLLRLEGEPALPWVARFLRPHHPDDASNEAAFAIAEQRSEAAAALLLRTYAQTRDPDFRDTLLAALAQTRQQTATDFLFELIAAGNRQARTALEDSAPASAVLERLAKTRPPD